MNSKQHIDDIIRHDKKSKKNRIVKNWMMDTNIPLLYDSYKTLSDLENDMSDFNSIPVELQVISNDKSIELFKSTNQERYNKLKHEFLIKASNDLLTYKPNKKDVKPNYIDPINMIMMLRECSNDEYWMEKYIAVAESYTPADIIDNLKDKKKMYRSYIESKVKDMNTWALSNEAFPMLTPDEIKTRPVEDKEAKTWLNSYTALFNGMQSKYNISSDILNSWKSRVVNLYNQYLTSKDEYKKRYKDLMYSYGWDIDVLIPDQYTINNMPRVKNILINLLNKITYFDLTGEYFPERPVGVSTKVPKNKLFVIACSDIKHTGYTELYISDTPEFHTSNVYLVKFMPLSDKEISINFIKKDIKYSKYLQYEDFVIDWPMNVSEFFIKVKSKAVLPNDYTETDMATIPFADYDASNLKLIFITILNIFEIFDYNKLNLYKIKDRNADVLNTHIWDLIHFIALTDDAEEAFKTAAVESASIYTTDNIDTLKEIKDHCKLELKDIL